MVEQSKTNWGVTLLLMLMTALIVFGILALIYYLVIRKRTITNGSFIPIEHPDQNIGRTGIWLKKTSTNNTDGLDYNDAQTYCQDENAKLATKNQLMTAYNQGFGICDYGWLDGTEAGYVMQNIDATCGNKAKGFTEAPEKSPAAKYGAYCYGTIPKNGDVTKSFILSPGSVTPFAS